MRVRDYECDLQGIVNNAIYQHYTEACRHEFIETKGIEFAELHERGIDVVVANLEMRFKTSLRPRDWFEVRLSMEKMGCATCSTKTLCAWSILHEQRKTHLMPKKPSASVRRRTLWRLSTDASPIALN